MKPESRQPPSSSPVRVTQRELIELAGKARALSLKSIRVRARKGGEYVSRLRGRGMEFDEARPYQPGDDPRNIDWRVTARTGKPFTKVFREERERPVLFLLDLRASMHFATRGCFKSVIAARIAGMLAWAAEQNGDRVGGFLFAENHHRELRPRTGERAVLRLIHEIASAPVWEPTAAADPALARASAIKAFGSLRKVEKSGSLVVLITDGRNLEPEAMTYLADLGRNNDVLIFFVFDAIEAELPPPGHYAVLRGAQSRSINTTPAALRQEYARQFEHRRSALSELARQHGMRFTALGTADDPYALLVQMLARQGRAA